MNRTPDTTATTSQALVIGLELPGFAKLPVAAQCRQQEQLQRRLSAALQSVPEKDRIVLDTPTGAAVVLFTSPAVALNIACALCGTRSAENGSIALRAGLALGPVRAVAGAGGALQIAGEPLETAERIVTLPTGERVVATRACADALRRELPACAAALRPLPKGTEPETALELVAIQITHPSILTFRRRRSGQSKPLLGWLTPPRAVVATLALVLTGWTWTTVVGSVRSHERPLSAVPPATVAALPAADPAKVAEVEPVADADHEAIPEEHATTAVNSTQPVHELPRQSHAVKVRRTLKVDPAPSPAAPAGTPVTEASLETPAVLADNRGEHGKVLLAIAPWGEVLVNGKSVGVSPPLTELELETGSHYLEVRNGTSAPLLRRIDVKNNETLKIRHRFADSQ